MSELTPYNGSNNDNEIIEVSGFYSDDLIVEDVADLYASKEDAQKLMAEGLVDQNFLISDTFDSEANYDASYTYHRTVNLGASPTKEKTEYIWWTKTPSKSEKEQGFTGEEIDPEDDRNPHHQIVGVRGVILSFNWGANFMVQLPQIDNNWISLCQTVGVEETLPDGRKRRNKIQNNYPLSKPIPTITRGTADAAKLGKPNFFFEQNPHISLIAERYDVTKLKKDDRKAYYASGTERRCLDCIAKGEHIIPVEGGAPKVCGMGGYILMAVFQLGYKDTTRYNQAPDQNPIDVKWVNVADAGLVDYRGNSLKRPFILRIDRITKGWLREKIGHGDNDLPIRLPRDYENANGRRKKNYYLPHNNLLTVRGLYDWLHKSGQGSSRVRMSKNGMPLYRAMVEMYTAPIDHTSSAKFKSVNKDHAPVFNPLELDELNYFNGIHIDQYLQTALLIAQQEYQEAKGNEVDFSKVPALTGASITPSTLAPRNENGNGEAAPAPTANPTPPPPSLGELAESAFKVRPKPTVE